MGKEKGEGSSGLAWGGEIGKREVEMGKGRRKGGWELLETGGSERVFWADLGPFGGGFGQ